MTMGWGDRGNSMWWRAALLVGLLASAAIVRADDDVVEEETPLDAPQFMMADENFDQWIYGGNRNAAAGRKRLDSQLQLRIDEVDRVCGVTPEQKKKLELAGRADIRRFHEQVDEKRKKFQLVKGDQNKIGEFFQEIQPLQLIVRNGPFGQGSFFDKALRKSLTAEQGAKFEKSDRERQTFRYRATVERVVAQLDDALALRAAQRSKLVQLLMDETRPIRRSGQYDTYIVMLQASKVPEEKIREILDEPQWKMFNQQLAQARGLEQFLKSNRLLDDDPAEEGGAAAAGAAQRANPPADTAAKVE
ncbi:MAG: hypothetical protein ACKV0T_28255 [Planctomycetales bacterium]